MPKTTYLARVSVVSAVVEEDGRMEFITGCCFFEWNIEYGIWNIEYGIE